jgi:hypothetical protein
MDSSGLKQSVAYCGLICRLCFLASGCDGCRSAEDHCERDRSDQGCFQKGCCREKGLDGCWDCPELAGCTQGIYALGEHSKVKAFALCIHEDGMEAFVDHVRRNARRGLSVEKGRDYDGLTIPAVLNLLRNGQA